MPWKPQGWGHPAADTANVLARREAALSRAIYDAGGFFSIENPESSYLWMLQEYRDLAKLEGVKFLVLDQSAFGSIYLKPTGILTNAPWLMTQTACRRCSNDTPHDHVP